MDIKELIVKAEKFIKDNKLDFSSTGSELNGNCVILAGFICYIIDNMGEGNDIIVNLPLTSEASDELQRVFNYAWYSNYEKYWETEEAKVQYIF